MLIPWKTGEGLISQILTLRWKILSRRATSETSRSRCIAVKLSYLMGSLQTLKTQCILGTEVLLVIDLPPLLIGEVGDTTISSPGRSPKQPLPGIGLHDHLHDRQACPEFIAFDQGVGQICPQSGIFSCRFLPKRGQICYTPAPPNR